MASERVEFHDLETSSLGFMILRQVTEGLAIGFGIESDGDLDLVVSNADARRLADAMTRAVQSPA